MKTVLIYGVSGQDGTCMAKPLLENRYEVHCSFRDAKTSSSRSLSQLSFRLDVQMISIIRNPLQNLLKTKPDELCNLAERSLVRLSFEPPVEMLESISFSILNLLEGIRFNNLSVRFYNVGSRSNKCFGDAGSIAVNKMNSLRPRGSDSGSQSSRVQAEVTAKHIGYKPALGYCSITNQHCDPNALLPKRLIACLSNCQWERKDTSTGRIDIVCVWGEHLSM